MNKFLIIENKSHSHYFYLGKSYDTENEISTLIFSGDVEINYENLQKNY